MQVTYGDGDEIPVDVCSKVDEAQWNSTYAFSPLLGFFAAQHASQTPETTWQI